MALKAPTAIGRYRLVRRIGAGGMGIVYEAIDSKDETQVAVKVLLPHAAEEAEGVLRFKREFRALARLRHPNIVRVFDAGIDNDTPYIVMEFLHGKDARDHLRSFPEGKVRDREVVRVLRQIFGALAHVHSRRIVHRDLKPENLLVTTDGRVKLMDFGVARMLRMPTNDDSGLLGTFAYMAPEQVTAQEIDGRADLYAIGVFLYEVLTGAYPFPVEPPAAALHHHVNTRPDLVQHKNPRADPVLSALAMKLLEKDPADRPQSAEEAATLLADSAASGAAPELSVSLPGQLFVPRFVARDEDLDWLDGVAGDAVAGRGRLVLVEGPSGVGKTRLIEELRFRARRRSHVLIGHATPEREKSYGAFQSILDGIAEIAARAPKDVVPRIVGRDVALIGTLSPRLASLGGPVTTDHLDAAERKIRLHKSIVGVVGRLSLTRPVVLIVEDVHWTDSLSLELIWDAARTLLAQRPGGMPSETVCPVAIVLTRRSLAEGPDTSEGLIRRLESKGQVDRLSLRPLTEDETAEMFQTMTGARPTPAMIQELVLMCHGLPLMVQEVIQSWFDEGVLSRDRTGWIFRGESLEGPGGGRARSSVSGSGPLEDPREHTGRKSRDDVVLGKLKSVDPSSRLLVERLALLGRLLPAELVSALSDMSEDNLLDAIDGLVRANVLVEEVSQDDVRYRFYHEGFREAVVRGLPREHRRELHLFVARRLERKFGKRRRELAHVLVRHFKQGGQPERSLRYLAMQAHAAEERGDLEGAMKRLEDALAVLDEAPNDVATATRRLRVVVQQIDLLLAFGHPEEALDRADPQAAISARSPRLMGSELALRRSAAQFALGMLDEALATLSRIPKPAPSRSLGARSLELEGRIRIARSEYTEARSVFEAARDVARSAGLSALASSLEAKIAVAMVHQGDFTGSLEKLEAALESARRGGDVRTVTELVGNIGLIHAARNNGGAAVACYREALELADARGIREERGRWSGALGVLLADSDEEEAARERLDEAIELASELGNKQGEARWRGELGAYLLRLGRVDEAQLELSRSLAVAREIGASRSEAWAQIHLGAVLLERALGREDEAKERVESGLEIARDQGNEDVHAVGLVMLGRAFVAKGNARKARECLEWAERIARAKKNMRLTRKIAEEFEKLDSRS
ncbi:MAG: protein kinase [Deltaproteobacteria bacterium]|nr:protein kinase [Deltaproteobacteria bacterium]